MSDKSVQAELRLPQKLSDDLDEVQGELGLRYRQDVIRLLLREAIQRRRDRKRTQEFRARRGQSLGKGQLSGT